MTKSYKKLEKEALCMEKEPHRRNSHCRLYKNHMGTHYYTNRQFNTYDSLERIAKKKLVRV